MNSTFDSNGMEWVCNVVDHLYSQVETLLFPTLVFCLPTALGFPHVAVSKYEMLKIVYRLDILGRDSIIVLVGAKGVPKVWFHFLSFTKDGSLLM